MSHYGLLCPPTPGHINPMTALGRTLRGRGHTVTLFQIANLRTQIEAEGLDFCPLGENSHGAELASSVERLGCLTGLSAARFTIRCAARLARITFEHAPAALLEARIDFAVVDQNEPAGATVADHLRLPYASVANLPLNREADVPPPFVSWPYSTSAAARLRNGVGYALADRLLSPLTGALNAQRVQWGLPPLRSPDDSFSRIAQICTLPRLLDYPRRQLPRCFHYVGPFIDSCRPPAAFPWHRLDARPLIYASFGTLQNRREDIFGTVAKACAGLNVQLVLAGGGSEIGLSNLPGQPVVVAYAPQLQLLRRAALVITHGGLNTVLEALHTGVPMVAIPITNDQPAVAARVQRAGAAEVVPLNRLSTASLRIAVERVVGSEKYRSSAQLLRQEILAAGGVERAADIVESVSAARAAAAGSGGY
jgi:MGT family glycosyltransferase